MYVSDFICFGLYGIFVFDWLVKSVNFYFGGCLKKSIVKRFVCG